MNANSQNKHTYQLKLGHTYKKLIKRIIPYAVLALFSGNSLAEDYAWFYPFDPNARIPDMESACIAATQKFSTLNGYTWVSGAVYGYYQSYYPTPVQCISTWVNKSGQIVTSHGYNAFIIYRTGTGCSEGKTFNPSTGACGFDEQKGAPSPMSCAGNPVNLTIGNKYERVQDYSSTGQDLGFSRVYNSLDGYWRHNFSTHLRIVGEKSISLIHADGKEEHFTFINNIITPGLNSLGSLIKTTSGWEYTSIDNERLKFDQSGKLSEQTSTKGYTSHIIYTAEKITVTDNIGNSLNFTEDSRNQPLTMSSQGFSITYGYDSENRLLTVSRISGTTIEHTTMVYEDSRDSKLLTGITDTNGVRIATWEYDAQGRATSSAHVNGTDKVSLVYNTDGSTAVTNEYGKKTIYKFQIIQGIKRITAIEGEPTPNCPSSNSKFTYDTRGLLKTKADAKGNLTTYEYNDRALETSRTEASGSAQARTITTEWHPTLFLKTKVTEPNRIITYQYDTQGRQTGQTITPR